MDTQKKIDRKRASNFVVYSVIIWQFIVFPLSNWVTGLSVGIVSTPVIVHIVMIILLEMLWVAGVVFVLKRWLKDA